MQEEYQRIPLQSELQLYKLTSQVRYAVQGIHFGYSICFNPHLFSMDSQGGSRLEIPPNQRVSWWLLPHQLQRTHIFTLNSCPENLGRSSRDECGLYNTIQILQQFFLITSSAITSEKFCTLKGESALIFSLFLLLPHSSSCSSFSVLHLCFLKSSICLSLPRATTASKTHLSHTTETIISRRNLGDAQKLECFWISFYFMFGCLSEILGKSGTEESATKPTKVAKICTAYCDIYHTTLRHHRFRIGLLPDK